MSTPTNIERKVKYLERRKEILFSNKTFKEWREEIIIYLKSLIWLEQELIRQKSETLDLKEDDVNKLIDSLEDKKLFIELTEAYQTFS